jgi:formate hydrogenlyase subunit 3/multisubunit Na+/H+ antiporter MnhD subunit
LNDALAFVRQHAPALLLALPLFGATAVAVLTPRRGGRLLLHAFGALSIAVALHLVAKVLAGEPVSYRLQDLSLRVDALSVVVLAVLFPLGWLAQWGVDSGGRAGALRTACGLFTLAASAGALMAGDLATLILFLGAAALSAAAATSLGDSEEPRAQPAALDQVLVLLAAVALASLGAGFVADHAGTLDLAALQSAAADDDLRAVGFAIVIAGLAALSGLAPVHGWTGRAAGVGARGASFAGFVARAAAFLGLLRCQGVALASASSDVADVLSAALAAMGVLTLAMGVLQALGARDFRRQAAHLFNIQLGAALLLASLQSELGVAAAILTLCVAAGTAATMLACADLARAEGSMETPFEAFHGWGSKRPLASFALAGALFAQAGAPLTLGFSARWISVQASFERGWYWAAALLSAACLVTVWVAGDLTQRLYGRQPSLISERVGGHAAAPLIVCVLLALAFGGLRGGEALAVAIAGGRAAGWP